ncbi:hypothetical protein [Dyadobacter sp. CY356]|jgi:hypothetical protein|uniref:hypothetical protein n=1 Tax=Dyadobacter sp. CY356 TaxID=2906442 RepID=UPI001F2E80CA|nr:hypothetical protein [Dyadobacter sp. CY356]MCF0058213.1 hypothetical protein [Dyadobacter sp. CY356]
MKKRIWFVAVLAAVGLYFTGCGVSRQVSEAKVFGDCKYKIASADSIYLAGIDINEFRNIKSMSDLNIARFPKLGLALLRKDVPLDLRVNLDINNPTRKKAAVNQLEYKVLLTNTEIFNGFFNQKIEVYPGSGSTRVPLKLSANVYNLLTNDQTRDEFINMVMTLTGKSDAKPAKFVVKVKPTLDLAGKTINYPGYITFDQEITTDMVLKTK